MNSAIAHLKIEARKGTFRPVIKHDGREYAGEKFSSAFDARCFAVDLCRRVGVTLYERGDHVMI